MMLKLCFRYKDGATICYDALNQAKFVTDYFCFECCFAADFSVGQKECHGKDGKI